MTPSTQPSATPPGVDLLGPVFVSYRVSDGSAHALKLAWALRATGVPVWHDETDPPSRRHDPTAEGGARFRVVGGCAGRDTGDQQVDRGPGAVSRRVRW